MQSQQALIDSEKHVNERSTEIDALDKKLKKKKNLRSFQKLHFRLRRRVQSHNPYRIPVKFRALDSFAKNPPKPKLKSRSQRRKPKNIMIEFSKRQKNGFWLETHLWMSKRTHMDIRYKISLNQTNLIKKEDKSAQTNSINKNSDDYDIKNYDWFNFLENSALKLKNDPDHMPEINYEQIYKENCVNGYKLALNLTQKCRRRQFRKIKNSSVAYDHSYLRTFRIIYQKEKFDKWFTPRQGFNKVEFKLTELDYFWNPKDNIILFQIHPVLIMNFLELIHGLDITYNQIPTSTYELYGPLSFVFLSEVMLYKNRKTFVDLIVHSRCENSDQPQSYVYNSFFDTLPEKSQIIMEKCRNKFYVGQTTNIPSKLSAFHNQKFSRQKKKTILQDEIEIDFMNDGIGDLSVFLKYNSSNLNTKLIHSTRSRRRKDCKKVVENIKKKSNPILQKKNIDETDVFDLNCSSVKINDLPNVLLAESLIQNELSVINNSISDSPQENSISEIEAQDNRMSNKKTEQNLTEYKTNLFILGFTKVDNKIHSIRIIFHENTIGKIFFCLLNRFNVQLIGLEDKIRLFTTFGIKHFPEHFINYQKILKMGTNLFTHLKEKKLRLFLHNSKSKERRISFNIFDMKSLIIDVPVGHKFKAGIGCLIYINKSEQNKESNLEPVGYVVDAFQSLDVGRFRANCWIKNEFISAKVFFIEHYLNDTFYKYDRPQPLATLTENGKTLMKNN